MRRPSELDEAEEAHAKAGAEGGAEEGGVVRWGSEVKPRRPQRRCNNGSLRISCCRVDDCNVLGCNLGDFQLTCDRHLVGNRRNPSVTLPLSVCYAATVWE